MSTASPSLDAQSIFDALAGWEEVERRLRVDDSSRVTWSLGWGSNGGLSEEFLLRAVRHPRPLYRIVAVERGRDFESVVLRGLRDPYWRVRWTAAQTGVAPPEVLAELVHDTSPEVRRVTAQNQRTPLSALRELLDDRVDAVKYTAAHHGALLETDLRRLAGHRDMEMRRIVAGRDDTPVDVLDALANDRAVAVAEAVGRNSEASPDALHRVTQRTHDQWTRKAIASNPRTRPDDLMYLLDHGDHATHRTVAKRSSVPEVLHRLAQCDDVLLRAAVLTNEALPTSALAVMPLGASVAEHRAAANHGNATWETCRRLAVHYLASKHHARRSIGVEMVAAGLRRVEGSLPTLPCVLEEPVDVVLALLTSRRTDELAAWAAGTAGPKWLREHVQYRLSR